VAVEEKGCPGIFLGDRGKQSKAAVRTLSHGYSIK